MKTGIRMTAGCWSGHHNRCSIPELCGCSCHAGQPQGREAFIEGSKRLGRSWGNSRRNVDEHGDTYPSENR